MDKRDNYKLDRSYQKEEYYLSMDAHTQSLIDLVVSLINDVHIIEKDPSLTARDYLQTMSPSNLLLESSTKITWGSALHAVLLDVFKGKDLMSQTREGTKH